MRNLFEDTLLRLRVRERKASIKSLAPIRILTHDLMIRVHALDHCATTTTTTNKLPGSGEEKPGGGQQGSVDGTEGGASHEDWDEPGVLAIHPVGKRHCNSLGPKSVEFGIFCSLSGTAFRL